MCKTATAYWNNLVAISSDLWTLRLVVKSGVLEVTWIRDCTSFIALLWCSTFDAYTIRVAQLFKGWFLGRGRAKRGCRPSPGGAGEGGIVQILLQGAKTFSVSVPYVPSCCPFFTFLPSLWSAGKIFFPFYPRQVPFTLGNCGSHPFSSYLL